MIAGQTGLSVLVQSARDGTCTGFQVVGVERPVRLHVAGQSDADERRVVAALESRLGTLGRRADCGDLPCGCILQALCKAEQESETRNILVWVGDGQVPSADSETLASSWVSKPGHAAVPVLPANASYDQSLPAALSSLHAIELATDDGETALRVLAAAGVADPDQRVFISYSHLDGTELAHALFRVLTESRFQVFLDAFSLAPGRDFAERIEHELIDKAFLVLVETPQAVVSAWVGREVALARRHRLGLAAVQLGQSGPQTPGIGTARRCVVQPSDLKASQLDEPAAAAVRKFLLARHAEAMLRRRQVLDFGLRCALLLVGVPSGSVRPAPGGLDVSAGGDYAVSLQPRPAGLLDMHRAGQRQRSTYQPVMVSARPRGVPERAALAWLSKVTPVHHRDEGKLLALASDIKAGSV